MSHVTHMGRHGGIHRFFFLCARSCSRHYCAHGVSQSCHESRHTHMSRHGGIHRLCVRGVRELAPAYRCAPRASESWVMSPIWIDVVYYTHHTCDARSCARYRCAPRASELWVMSHIWIDIVARLAQDRIWIVVASYPSIWCMTQRDLAPAIVISLCA